VGLINLWLNKQPFSGARILTGTSAVLGVSLLITDGYLAKLAGSSENLIGVFMAMLCALLVGLYVVMARPIVGRYGALRVTAITMMLGAVGLWLVVGIFWNVWVNPLTLFDRPASQAASLLIIALWNTTITQYLWIGGLAAVPDITRGSYLFFLKPVIAAILAVLFLNLSLTMWQVLAIGVICASVLFEASWARLRRMGDVGRN
jgi:drug/metabolite transporter (DMT)-like permease